MTWIHTPRYPQETALGEGLCCSHCSPFKLTGGVGSPSGAEIAPSVDLQALGPGLRGGVTKWWAALSMVSSLSFMSPQLPAACPTGS